MHIHILGICGTFMGGLAQLAHALGHRVSGCDAGIYPPMSDQLASAGIELHEGYDAAQIALSPDLYVVGNAISRGNPLLEEILDRGLPYVSGPHWVAEHVLQGKWVLAVAGTHGKTSTASMLAWILEEAGLSPGFLIGGVPLDFGVSARLGGKPGSNGAENAFFVIEADEYDTAFCDKRSKFVHYRARTAILNNLEFDHADIFSDLAAIETQFHHFVRILPRTGLIVAPTATESLERVFARGCWTPIDTFGAGGWRAEGDDASGALRLIAPGNEAAPEMIGETRWSQTGEHNRANAVAALLAARHAGVPLERGLAALARFSGVKRRLELRGVAGGISVYDDFAHHPTALASTLSGLRKKLGERTRILAVIEPRSNTMKLGTMKARLAGSLQEADQVFCYSAGLDWDAAQALAPLGPKACAIADFPRLVDAIVSAARPGDHVLVMSNGGFGGIHGKLLERLRGQGEALQIP
ncbi:MAG: UDP-N-acetylmuramate:L-alanyl-gamma-D-glutamyl-meso-diaminopimelate ligase [Betaproteobacteria bacterium]|nr:UDP-N-acetylmuramate:L-alanyl-gamma-D-glutamyl-meso-diaminopimelate ligase [Betaproteobacteria bacterium]